MSVRVDIEESIDRPVEEVFDRLADIDGYPDWLPRAGIYRGGGLVDPHESVGNGTEFYDDTIFGRFRGRVTVFEPPDRIEFHQTLRLGGARLFDSLPGYELESTDEGTRVHHYGEARPHGPLRLLEPLFRAIARRERKRVIDELSDSMTGD